MEAYMNKISAKFPEFKCAQDPSQVPWKDALVWIDQENGVDKYFWIMSEEILYVSWTGGLFSVIPSSASILSSYFQAFTINSKNIFVGSKVKVGN